MRCLFPHYLLRQSGFLTVMCLGVAKMLIFDNALNMALLHCGTKLTKHCGGVSGFHLTIFIGKGLSSKSNMAFIM